MKRILPVLTLVVLIALVGAGFYFLNGTQEDGSDLMGFKEVSVQGAELADAATTTDAQKPLAETTPETTQVTADMRGYQNSKFKFGLLYPQNMSVHEYTERDGAMSVTFNNDATNESFQIYVTPFSGTQITTERFRLDEPSGVYLQPTDILVDNTRATMFFSRNTIMGDTREVWFIHDGFLYEVTTYKELDAWLGGLMKTWKFL